MSESDSSTSRAKRGRRPGSGSTREAVLSAARAQFAVKGFTATTIRSVAADAGVDPSQVMQFFRNKEELFAAVMAVPASALERFDTAFRGPREHLGERVVRAFLAAWESEPEEAQPLLAMLRGAIVNESARAQLADFTQSRLLVGARERAEADAEVRAALASSMLVGLITGRDVIGVPTLAEADAEEIVAIVAPAIQAILAPAT
ncbi:MULTISPECIES: TetR family transcriptional regulator [unclassified Brevibacterium]|uniref:TetR/AcrR family transcriptional regulator n=1 Tax=unclassified Brevibacterium TaxID=2614124 RepID=UPI001091ED36|nr:TetR family transcriptional regulator [Brevibacterium sp. S22]TGD31090.1 TetR/AcrR family transcriptional regulator [Brevibacterium sp. S22]